MKKIKKIYTFIIDLTKEYIAYIVFALIIIFLIFAGYEYYNKYFEILKNPEEIKQMVLSYGKFSVLAFCILQIVQVVAFFIPGEVVQIAGGYIYGPFYGSILSIIGISIGNIIVYTIARVFGRPFVKKIISDKDIKFFDRVSQYGNINYIVFLLYLIPGIPKDALGYICGVSQIKNKDFYFYSTVGRLPGILVSSYFGSKINTGNRQTLIIIGVAMSLLFFIGIIKGDKILKKMTEK